MLTADLLRARVRSGVVKPQYVKASEEVLAAAAALIEVYRSGINGPASAMQERIDDLVGHATDFLLWRGLAKLLDDRSEYGTEAVAEPTELRKRVFELAFAGPPVDEARRVEVLASVADEFGVTAEQVEAGLYADLADRQRLVSFKDLEPEQLLQRYNLALAQAVLFRASSLQITLHKPNPDKLRYLMSAMKFHGLMHRASKTDDGVQIELDGPASLLKLSKKYGLNMAKFLPALVLLKKWELGAVIDWKGKARDFTLTSGQGLQSHYKARGQWRTDEEKWFEEKFAKFTTEWTLERRGSIVELADGEVLVADYALTSPAGQEVAVEIVSFWRAAYLRRRIELLDSVDRPFVLVVSERLRADREALEGDLPLEVVFYKGVILPKKVIAAAEHALG